MKKSYEKLPTDGHQKCSDCGTVTTIEQSFKKVRQSFGRKPKLYCPYCWQKRQNVYFVKSLIVLTVVGIAFICMDSNHFLGWLSLNIVLINLFIILLIIPHEIGHAVAGQLLGMRLFRIIVGFGKTLFTVKIFGWLWEFKAIPLIGMTIIANKSRHRYRLKQFIVILSGPLANVLVMIILLKTFSVDFAYNDFVSKLTLILNFFIANTIVLFGNLWPKNIQTIYGNLPSDGLSLFTTINLSQSKIDERLALFYALEGGEQLIQKQWKSAKQWYEMGLNEFPNNPICLNDMAILALKTGNFNIAKVIFEKLVQYNKIEQQLKILIKNNLAYTYAILGKEELLVEADRLSKEVYDSAPWVSMFKGTRGVVLIELDKLNEGLAVLREAMAIEDMPENKASLACYIAIGESRKTNIRVGRKYLSEAKQLDSDCYLIPIAEREMGLNELSQ